jgi:DNA-binding transcriptional MerR regulator
MRRTTRKDGPVYRAGEFASLAGVTVRALHHYDRMRLLVPSARSDLEQRGRARNPERQGQVTRQWNQLIADVEACLGEDPAGPKAQELAARWRELVAGFTGGDREIQRGLNRMGSDQENWPPDARQRHGIKPEIQEFILRAIRAAPRG